MKLNVGDSVNFKNGKTGIVEDFDDKYLYVRDQNGAAVKIIKDRKYTLTMSPLYYLSKLKNPESILGDYYKDFLNNKRIENELRVICEKIQENYRLERLAKLTPHMSMMIDEIGNNENLSEEQQDELIDKAYRDELEVLINIESEMKKNQTVNNSIGSTSIQNEYPSSDFQCNYFPRH